MTQHSDDDQYDQDAEPTMTAPGEGRPDGTETSRPSGGDKVEPGEDDAQGTRRKEGYFEQPE
jgi:hypothetical protein